MHEPLSLMEFLQELLTDPGMRGDFLADPHSTLTGHGLADLSPADVHDALVLLEDTRTADFHHGFGTGADPVPYGTPPVPGDGDQADAVGYLSTYLADDPVTREPVADDDYPLDFGSGSSPAPAPDPYEGLFDLDTDAPDSSAGPDTDDDYGSGAVDHPGQHHDVDF